MNSNMFTASLLALPTMAILPFIIIMSGKTQAKLFLLQLTLFLVQIGFLIASLVGGN